MKRKPIASVAAVIVAGLVCVLGVAGAAIWHATRALHLAVHSYRTEHQIDFTVRPLALIENVGFEPVSALSVFSQTAEFQGKLCIASPSGLLVY